MESPVIISGAMFSSWFMRFRFACEFARLPAASRGSLKQTEPTTRPDAQQAIPNCGVRVHHGGRRLTFLLMDEFRNRGPEIRRRKSELGERRESLNKLIYKNTVVGTNVSINKFQSGGHGWQGYRRLCAGIRESTRLAARIQCAPIQRAASTIAIASCSIIP